MAGNVQWNGDAFQRAVEAEMGRRLKAACSYLAGQVKADISQPGTLRFNPVSKTGKVSKRQKTIYNFTHSRPQNPPYKQSGNLRRSIAYEVKGLTGRVGTGVLYGWFLSKGTRRMAARPFLDTNLRKHFPAIRAILLKQIPAGGLPGVTSNQSRSGHFGAGARQAGYS